MTDRGSDSAETAQQAPHPTPDEVSAQLGRVLASADFGQSERLRKFLRFVVEETLAGRAATLKEYTIALEVFERDDSFGPQTSSIVRVEASRLRAKLEKYNAVDGRDDAIRISLPTGSYVPTFEAAPAPLAREPVLSRPSVAVLPFTNMSGDVEQEYFADGLTEDIITALSYSSSFPVIARNSTFTYKGNPVRVQQVAQELGAHYVVEGGVRKAGNRIRITVQLIKADTGHHVWAEKYDRAVDDVFDVQDEITRRVAGVVVPTLEMAEQKRVVAKKTETLDAWDCYLRGRAYLNEQTKRGTIEARTMFERALALDPGYSQAYAGLAHSHHRDVVFGYGEDRAESSRLCIAAAQRAVALDDDDAWAHVILGLALARAGRFELAAAQSMRAMELDPTGAGRIAYGVQLIYLGRPGEGIPYIEQGLEISPKDPYNHFFMTRLADAHMQCRDYEKAVEWAQKAIGRRADHLDAHVVLAASFGHLGQESEAEEALGGCRRIQPELATN